MITNPRDYALKHGMTFEKAAEEVGIQINALYKYNSRNPQTRRNMSPTVMRCTQLLDFIRESGLEPPPPVA